MLDFSILDKLYLWSRDDAIDDIVRAYTSTWSCVVNYLYFTNLARERLVEWTPASVQKKYLQALHTGDFLFADGIALQLFYRRFLSKPSGKMPENLNGTDLNPWLIEQLLKKSSVSLYLYQCYDPPKGKTVAYLQEGIRALKKKFPWLDMPRAEQCLYRDKGTDFDRVWVENLASADQSEVKIFFNCTWSPFQETWVMEHEQRLRALWFLIINAWGTIDYLTWFEKRAPQWVVRARVLETFRRITTKPKKNMKKFLWMFGFFRILAKNLLIQMKKLLHLTDR